MREKTDGHINRKMNLHKEVMKEIQVNNKKIISNINNQINGN